MRKTLLLTLIFLTSKCFAQNVPILLNGDFGISNVKYKGSKGTSAFAASIGLETYIPLIKMESSSAILLNPGIAYQSTGYESSGGGKVKVKYATFSMPVLLKFGEGLGSDAPALFGGVGPFVSYALSGKFRQLVVDDYTKMKFGNSTADNRRSYDAGIALKAGMMIKKVEISIQNNIGLVNLIPKDRIVNDEYIKSRNFVFSVAYAFNVKNK